MRLSKRTVMIVGALALLLCGLVQPAFADYALNMPEGVTDTSREIYGLHMTILWICVIIGIVVYGAMFYSIVRHRKSRGVKAAQFHHSTALEIVWTIIPLVILVAMAIPATGVLVDMEDTSDAEMSVKITGYQWKWQYEYVGEGVSFYSSLDADSQEARRLGAEREPESVDNYLLNVDNRLVLPTNTKVRLLITSNDVIHAWWVPDLGWKKDAIPGYVNATWTEIKEPGVYRGQCAELCGRDHAYMPIVVEAKTPEDFKAWLAEQKGEAGTVGSQGASADGTASADGEDVAQAEGTMADADSGSEQTQAAADDAGSGGQMDKAELMSLGEEVYNARCVACHQANGQGMPPTFPALTGGAIATGPVAGHLDIVINGSPGTAMAAFGSQLSDAEIAAVVTYERNALGNDTGDVVQPSDVQAAR